MYKIEVSVLGVSRTMHSRFRLSKWHVGLVFLGSWYLAVGLLALYGDPSLRSGSGVFLRLSGLGVLFAIVPTGLMFAIAGASVSRAANASGQSEQGDLSVTGGTTRVSLNRVLLIMVLIVTLGAVWDWSRASKARENATKAVVFQGHTKATYRS